MIKELKDFLNPINHILYEIAILLLLFILIRKQLFFNKLTKEFIILICIIIIIIDWYIWNNKIQTILFSVLLLVYIKYLFYSNHIISSFVNVLSNDINNINIINNSTKHKILLNQKNEKNIKDLIYTPKGLNLNYMDTIQYYDPNKTIFNELDKAYQSKYPLNPLDQYINSSLNSLYESPQYQNILQTDIDQFLNNNIHNQQKNNNTNILLFKNPKKQFLDSNWYLATQPYYNDHCYDNMSKDDIVKFGYKLQYCTNQQNQLLNQTIS